MIDELWVIPIMLRLALIEILRRVVVKFAAGRTESNLADAWADAMIEMVEKDPKAQDEIHSFLSFSTLSFSFQSSLIV